MEMKPGYKQTEVGVIPEEWDSEPCSKLCVKIQDGTHFSPTIRGNDFLYLTSKNVRFGYLDVSTADRIDAAQHEAIYKRCDVKYGDLLLTKDGANTGNAALNTLTEQFSLLSSVALLRFDPKQHSAAYFLQQCLSAPGQQRMKDAMSGNAITRLTLEKIRKLRFPVAPLPEQRAIAEALSDVDGLLGGLDRLIAKKRDLKQAAMQQLLTGQTRLPGFHGEWETQSVAELEKRRLVKLSRGKVISKKDIESTPGDFPIYSSSVHNDGLFGRYGQFMFDEELISWSVDGGGNFFHRPKHKFSVTNVCGFMRVDTSRISYRFFAAHLQLLHSRKSFDYQSKAHPSVVRKEYDVQLPTLAEQTAIAEVLTEMDLELAGLEQRREKTRALKQAMMQELLTGKTRLV
jgi:type I restriction enzyme S subunit